MSGEASAIYKKVGFQPLARLGLNSSDVTALMHVYTDDIIQVVLNTSRCREIPQVVCKLQRVHMKRIIQG